MHGLSVADEIIRMVSAEHVKRPHSNVVEVKVNVGRYMFHELEELYSAWNLLVTDSPLKKAKLTVELVDGSDCTLDSVVFD